MKETIMKTKKTIYEVSNTINTNPLDVTNLLSFKIFNLPICAAVVMSISLGFVTKPVRAENTGTEDIQHYRYVESQGAKNSTSGDKNTPINRKTDPVSKPADGKGALPTFEQADVNGDHYITKEELKNFPYLLQVFDKVDAGEDGKLEQHEYQNLEMETKREGEIR